MQQSEAGIQPGPVMGGGRLAMSPVDSRPEREKPGKVTNGIATVAGHIDELKADLDRLIELATFIRAKL